MSIAYLPKDLLVLVLVRLPTKSLLRFKSVSKSWKELISYRYFVKLHLNQPHINQNPSILVYKEDPIQAVQISVTGENIELGREIQQINHPFETTPSKFRVVGCCHGLLCLIRSPYHELCGIFEYDISLCNPQTNSSWDVPYTGSGYHDPWGERCKERDGVSLAFGIAGSGGRLARQAMPTTPPLKRAIENKESRRIWFFGFGYNDVNDDYKVMVATRDYEYKEHVFEVYSLRTRSWSIKRSYLDYGDNLPFKGACDDVDGVFVNCALHWNFHSYNKDRNTWKTCILVFDLRTDKNRYMLLPDVLEKNTDLRLCVLINGCLAISESGWTDFNTWVMKDYDLKDSWIKISINNLPLDWYYTPVDILEGNNLGKVIFYGRDKGTIYLYDLVTREILERIHIAQNKSSIYFPFVGSIVNCLPKTAKKLLL